MDLGLVVSGTDVGVTPPSLPDELNVLSLAWEPSRWTLSIDVGMPLLVGAIAIVLFLVGLRIAMWFRRGAAMEIDQAELGLGDSKVTLRPNLTDRQVAYSIWVELSTRKIGLSIDLEDDVISEIYDSWYSYFSVTRDLIKTIPVSRLKDPSTREIVNLSIEVLNSGLRPHLTKWQARYRDWYERKVNRIYENANDSVVLDPQAVQKQFPKYEELSAELLSVNKKLIAYRRSMHSLVFGKQIRA